MIKDESRDVVKQGKLQSGKHGSGLAGEDSKPVAELHVTEAGTEVHVWEEMEMPALDLSWI